jgi:hypothetical protein
MMQELVNAGADMDTSHIQDSPATGRSSLYVSTYQDRNDLKTHSSCVVDRCDVSTADHLHFFCAKHLAAYKTTTSTQIRYDL